MKLKLIALFFLISSVAICQQSEIKSNVKNDIFTTQNEYDYIANNGLRRYYEEGADMKMNYRLISFHKQNIADSYIFEYFFFYNTELNALKAIAVKITSNVSKKNHYLCIPINNKELTLKYLSVVSSFTPEMAKSYAFVSSDALAKMSQFHFEENKKLPFN